MGEAGGCWRKLYGGAVGGAVWVLWPSIVGKVVWGRCVEGAVHVGENWKAVGWGAGKLWRKLCGVELCDGKLCGGLWGNHGGGLWEGCFPAVLGSCVGGAVFHSCLASLIHSWKSGIR